jgi:hypothetical protein
MRWICVIFFLTGFAGHAQEAVLSQETHDDSFNQYLAMFSQVDGRSIPTPNISEFVERLNQKDKNTIKFCRTLFHKTRYDFLRRYDQYASFRSTLTRGTYNCLTGTALYALLLDHFGIAYSIIETNYHIFLIASTAEGKVLFEATDPIHGFVSNPGEIDKRIALYKQNTLQASTDDDKQYYEYSVNLYNAVTLDQLKGLLHYNVSTEAYNQQNFQRAIDHLSLALDLYHSPRLREFSSILLLAIMESNVPHEAKQDYLKQIQAIRKKQVAMTASRITRR